MTTEEQLIQMVEDVLEIDGVGSMDRFEDLGGNSLNLAQLLSRVRERFGVAPKPRQFFDPESSTMRAIALSIDELSQQPAATVRA